MNSPVKIGLSVALVWIVIKYAFFLINPEMQDVSPLIFINMFLLLTAIALGLFFHKKHEGFLEGNALSDIKTSMKAGVPYALAVSLFIYLYYAKINPDFVAHKISEATMTIRKAVDDPIMLAKIKNEQAAFEVMDKEAIYTQLIDGPANFYSAFSTSIIALLGLTLLATLYSVFVTIIFRKVLLRKLK